MKKPRETFETAADAADEDEGPERRCIVSGERLPVDRLIRFVIGPDDTLVPDLGGKLPGRGIWVEARAEQIGKALQRRLFDKAARRSLTVPADLAAALERALRRRALDALGLARRAGDLVLGYEKVQSALAKPGVAAIIEAADAAPDGKRRIVEAAKRAPEPPMLVEGPAAEEMGLALGRSNVVHAALKKGHMCEKVLADLARWREFGHDGAQRSKD